MPPRQSSTFTSLTPYLRGATPGAQSRPFPFSPRLGRVLQAIVDNPELFTSLGFTGGPGSSLTDPCLVLDFVVDSQAEIMGTQVSSEPFGRHKQQPALLTSVGHLPLRTPEIISNQHPCSFAMLVG